MYFKQLATLMLLMFSITSCNNSPKDKKAIENQEVKAPVDSIITRPATRQELDRLKGSWQRTDGGYVIEISAVNDDGTLVAKYLNPGSIHVEDARWIFKKGILYIRVILRDVNYPGSTYTLAFKAENDYFMGNYYQAVEGTNYDVIFTRKQ